MAKEVEMRHANCRTSEENDGTIRVEVDARGLQPDKDGKQAKNGEVCVDWFNKGRGLGIKITVEEKNGRKTTQYIKTIEKMPGKIIKEDSSFHVEKDKVVIKMIKAVNESWKPHLQAKGLSYASSSSEED